MDNGIVPVECAAADAAGFSAVLELHGFAKDDQLLLLDDDATKSRMESRITQFMRGVGQDDVLYVFYAGHGLAVNGCNYRRPLNSPEADLRRRAKRRKQLQKNLQKYYKRNILCLQKVAGWLQ